ncbi:MAG: hypothetical protein U0Z26_09370 [Anaerolineales bacterium]
MRKIFSEIGAFLQTPVGILLTITVVWHIVLYALGIPINYFVSGFLFLVDIAATFYILDRLTYFFSQFILPIQDSKQRQEIYERVQMFEPGKRGPALFIKNGKVIMHEGEKEKRGAGVIVLDTASAALLQTDTEIRDTVGPGIKFTQKGEYIAGSVDLRTQLQFIGPIEDHQLSLYPSLVISPVQETSGWTRDGFEVSPIISVKFSIKRSAENKPSESGVTSRYGYDASAVRNAIMGEAIQLGASDNKVFMEWKNLPAHLVVNLWRDYIRKFKLNDLFSSDDNALQTIEKMINMRLKQKDVIGLDDIGKPSGEWLRSVEFEQLESRGLQVIDVKIHNVLLEEPQEDQLIHQWKAEWLNTAKKEQAQLKEMEALAETASREEASKEFAKISSSLFRAKITEPQKSPFKLLQLLIHPIKDAQLTQHSADPEMEDDLRKIDEIWKWLLDNNPDGGPKAGQG